MISSFKENYGPWAVVTGASSGIGAEFAQQLGALGLNLLLVARRMDRLNQLAEQLTHEHAIEVRPVACDLSKADFLDTLRPVIGDLEIGLLVNNAGFANTGAVVDNDLERELELLHVNCRAYLVLAHEIGNILKSRGRGGLLFVSSSTAFVPTALWANYSASKAYELALGEAMHREMRPTGVDVLVVCPGPTRTPFYDVSDQDLTKTPGRSRFMLAKPSDIARTALSSMGKKRLVIVGWGNKLAVQSGRFLPRNVIANQVGKFVASIRR